MNITMKAFGLGLGTMLLRYYLMMLVVVAAGFTGQWWLAVLALPIFLSTVLGVRFSRSDKAEGSVKAMESGAAQAGRKVG
jgi:hypothetical protein